MPNGHYWAYRTILKLCAVWVYYQAVRRRWLDIRKHLNVSCSIIDTRCIDNNLNVCTMHIAHSMYSLVNGPFSVNAVQSTLCDAHANISTLRWYLFLLFMCILSIICNRTISSDRAFEWEKRKKPTLHQDNIPKKKLKGVVTRMTFEDLKELPISVIKTT